MKILKLGEKKIQVFPEGLLEQFAFGIYRQGVEIPFDNNSPELLRGKTFEITSWELDVTNHSCTSLTLEEIQPCLISRWIIEDSS
jgi:hypothetical protein